MEEEPRCRRAPAPALQQLGALLKKNFKLKLKAPVSTLFEICSPLLVTFLLVLGYSLSEVIVVQQRDYTSLNLSVPPATNVTPPSSTAGAQGGVDSISQLMAGPLPVPNLDQYVNLAETVANSSALHDVRQMLIGSAAGRGFYNFFEGVGTLHFAPDTELTRELIQYLRVNTTSFDT
ncbi:unnamed protein product, partial [Chrysoparadoxa australica]